MLKVMLKYGLIALVAILVISSEIALVFLYKPSTIPLEAPLSTILIDGGLIDGNSSYLTYSSIAFSVDDVRFAIKGLFNFTIPVGIIHTTITAPIRQLKLELIATSKLICILSLLYESHTSTFEGIKGAATNGWIFFTLHFIYHVEVSELGVFEYNCTITRFDIQKVEREYVFLGENNRRTCLGFTLPVVNIDEVSFNTTWGTYKP